MGLYKELLKRRIPQILASYFIAGATFILFMDWVVNRYGLAEYYTTMALFSVIAILPSVIILSYFHGAPGKDQWNKIEKIGIPVNMIFIISIFFIGHKGNWWFKSDHVEENNNFYINLTSSNEYIKYYKNKETPFDNSYTSDKYLIESLHDSLLNKIKSSVFRSVSNDYANHGINIDVSFTKEENEAFDLLYHPILFELTDSEKDTLSNRLDGIINILDEHYIHYDGSLPNTIIRYFIYQITNLNTKENFYSYQTTSSWGESVRTHSSTQYAGWQGKYDISGGELKELIDALSTAAKNKIYQRRYKGGITGEVIEKLDHEMVRIKQYYPGAIKKKMRLKSKREYVWDEGGVDILIEDYMMFVDYMKNTDPVKIWDYGESHPDSEWANKLKVYDEVAYKEELDQAIVSIIEEIESIREQDTTGGFYDNTVSIDSNFDQYFLEVTAVEDSIVIAKIIGSRNPVFNVRKGDWIFITK